MGWGIRVGIDPISIRWRFGSTWVSQSKVRHYRRIDATSMRQAIVETNVTQTESADEVGSSRVRAGTGAGRGRVRLRATWSPRRRKSTRHDCVGKRLAG
jgi:hypothetical protein